jgi:hypothetical protein
MLTGDLADAEGVQITPYLDEHQGQTIAHDPKQSERVLWIPNHEGGELRLEADGTSNNPNACRTAHATAEVTIQPEFDHPIPVTLEFAPAQCLLSVELQGIDSVISQPAGIDCQGAVLCSGGFPRGQQVTLQAGTLPSRRYAEWSGACQAQGASCVMTAPTASKVHVRDSRGICSDGNWCWQNRLPQGNWLRAIWGSDASNVWAVGDAGTILKWDGTAWSQQYSGTASSLYGVWGSDASNIWAVGDAGTILKWNGAAWSPQSSGTANILYSVWGSDASNIWAVGNAGTI